MRIYRCDCCRYTFRYPIKPPACPDCGKHAVRPATGREVKIYRADQKILAEEIRKGLYAAAAG